MDDIDLLSDLDLSKFTDAQKGNIEASLYNKYEERLGEKIAPLVTAEKFAELELVISQGDEEKVEYWLEVNVPGYENLASQTLEELKQEVRQNPQAFLSPEPNS
jgi:hypothetical protein